MCTKQSQQNFLPPFKITSIFFLSSSVGDSPGPSGSLSQSVSTCVREAGASPAAAGLQCSWIHDVKAY